MLVEGKVLTTREVKAGKTIKEHSADSGSLDVAEVEFAKNRVGISVGRTVNLGDFNFARIEIAVESDGSGSDAIDCAHSIANEVLSREIAYLTQRDRENADLSFANDLTGRKIRVTYGMTKALKAFESFKFDVTIERCASDGSDFEAFLLTIQEQTASFIEKELNRINSSSVDGGF
jgi:hypothetical protein